MRQQVDLRPSRRAHISCADSKPPCATSGACSQQTSAEDLETLATEFAALEAEVTMLRMDEGAAHVPADVSSKEDATTRV